MFLISVSLAPLRHRRVSDLDPISVGTVIFAFQCATIEASWIAHNSLSLLFAITQCAMIAASQIADSVDAVSILNLLSVAKS